MYIAIEGNIGAGKSTLLEPLANELGFEIIQEGIETDQGFQEKLAAFYATGGKAEFDALQYYLAYYRANIISELDPAKNYLMERSIQGAVLFCLAEGHTDTATWTLRDFNHIEKPFHYLYVRCPAALCKERIIKRGRECELTIPVEYLERVEKAHDDWGRMAEWAGMATIVNSENVVNVEELAHYIREVIRVKVG